MPSSSARPRRCAACGAPVPPPFRAPAPQQAPDLDLRPGAPTRSTLARWLQTCPACGAVAPDLVALPETAVAAVRSPEYQRLAARVAASLPFLRWALLCRPEQRHEALLQAAWAADDAGESSEAARLRRQAAAVWGEPEGAESALRLIDVLRCAGEFELARVRATALDPDALDEASAAVLVFQRARIAAADAERHLMSSALPPPAARPLIGPPKPRRSGLLGRLFRR